MKTAKQRINKTRKTRKASNERPIINLWKSFASGKYAFVVPKNGAPYKVMKPSLKTYEELKADPEVKAILTSGMSRDYAERLVAQAKKSNHSVNDVIAHYKSYFLHYSPDDKVWYLK